MHEQVPTADPQSNSGAKTKVSFRAQARHQRWLKQREETMHKIVRRIAAGTALTACAMTNAPAMAWEPTKPVEIVVAAGAGGASDQMARMMQAAIQKNNLMKQPMVVSL